MGIYFDNASTTFPKPRGVAEAMSAIGERGASNDHAMRDFVVSVPSFGTLEVGNALGGGCVVTIRLPIKE